MAATPAITLYTDSTPNGIKISIALEELGIPYNTEHVDVSTKRQKEPWFLEINPNGRIPAITDTFQDGKPIHVFEGGSILQYLVERYDPEHRISFEPGSREHFECNNWLFFQHGGIGPMQGQANHFVRYAPEQIPYGIERYKNETRRLYRVLEGHLSQSPSAYLVGDHISIADIACIGWVIWLGYAAVEIDEFPHLKAWKLKMCARPAVVRGCNVPTPLKALELLKDKVALAEYTLRMGKWVVEGMQEDKAAGAK